MVRLALLACLVACQGGGEAPARVETGSAAPHDAGGHAGFGGHDAATLADAAEEHPAKPEEAEAIADPNRTLVKLGAIPAWQAVVDRTLYLARRGQHGVVFGTIDPPDEPPYTWLVDDTEGNGSLGIRVALGMKGAKEGDRVALGGAWQLDAARHWFWQVDSLAQLPPLAIEPKDPRPPVPNHAIANGELPPGAKTISLAKDGDVAYFTVVGQPPAIDGDGWPVADELGNPVYAMMTLPGERASYGGQDMRAPDERWQLKRGQTYWVRLGHFHKHGDKPMTVTTRTAPVRVK